MTTMQNGEITRRFVVRTASLNLASDHFSHRRSRSLFKRVEKSTEKRTLTRKGEHKRVHHTAPPVLPFCGGRKRSRSDI